MEDQDYVEHRYEPQDPSRIISPEEQAKLAKPNNKFRDMTISTGDNTQIREASKSPLGRGIAQEASTEWWSKSLPTHTLKKGETTSAEKSKIHQNLQRTWNNLAAILAQIDSI